MANAKKITVEVPEDLLDKAVECSGQSITETVRRGLELVAASESQKKLLKLRGKYKSTLDLKDLRDDKK